MTWWFHCCLKYTTRQMSDVMAHSARSSVLWCMQWSRYQTTLCQRPRGCFALNIMIGWWDVVATGHVRMWRMQRTNTLPHHTTWANLIVGCLSTHACFGSGSPRLCLTSVARTFNWPATVKVPPPPAHAVGLQTSLLPILPDARTRAAPRCLASRLLCSLTGFTILTCKRI